MERSREIIWHLVCTHCKGWWSVATMEDWKPTKLYCTHCGKKCLYDGAEIRIDRQDRRVELPGSKRRYREENYNCK